MKKNKEQLGKFSRLFTLFLILMVSSYFSCTKIENEIPTKTTTSKSVESKPIVFNISDMDKSNTKSNVSIRTVLGEKRNNPFTTTKIAEAHRNLYSSTVQEMETTDYYVKFEPNSLDDIEALYATDEIFYDYPLEYEVIEMGDYYDEAEGEEYPTLYAIVGADFEFPSVTYHIIANLYLDQSNPLLNAEALRITGNNADILDYIGFDLEEVGDENLGMVPIQPDCPDGCVAKLRIIEASSGHPVQYEWYCDCTPPTPSTSCYPNLKQREPGGIIRVDDTQLSSNSNTSTYLPVRRVMVIVKDKWFFERSTWTNDDGCWKINKNYYGHIRISIKFKNSRCKIRGTNYHFKGLWQWAITAKKKVGKISGPTFNNIEINISRWTTKGSYTHLAWGASTVNNAIHEFYDYASQEGINPPPAVLNVFIGRNHSNGSAMMAKKMGSANFGSAVGSGLYIGHFWIAFFADLPSVCYTVAVVTTLFPDMYVGFDIEESDRLKRLTYHELAHTSHYTNVNIPFWQSVIIAEVAADGHGNENSFDAGRIALVESWAEHIGMSFAHKTYGLNAWFVPTYDDYLDLLENRRNEETNHIPRGYYLDLIDGIDITEIAGDGAWGVINPGTINDNISGLTNAQLFSLLDNTVTSPTIFTNHLNNSGFITGSNTVQNVNALFNSY